MSGDEEFSTGGGDLRPATSDDLAEALAFALRFERSGKATRGAGEIMARITASRLVDHLARAGFVVLKREALTGHGGLARGARKG